MISCDALIVGAGPAGTIAALELARAGLRVVFVDGPDRKLPKIGEVLPAVGLRLLRSLHLDLSQFGTVHSRIGGNLICWASDELECTDFFCDPDGPGWRLSRCHFDEYLRSAAESAGVLHHPFNIDCVEGMGKRWTLHTRVGEVFECRWLVEATGRGSSIARRLGVRRFRDEGLVALWALGAPRPGEGFDRTLIEAVPEGWWYGAVLPEGLALLALFLDPRDSASVRTRWRSALTETSFVREFFDESSFVGAPIVAEAGGGWLHTVHGPNWVACGDAAISFDPLSSQGIYTAMYSGLIAAKSIVATEHGQPTAMAKYAREINEIRRVYRTRLISTYDMVKRWAGHHFWNIRQSRIEIC